MKQWTTEDVTNWLKWTGLETDESSTEWPLLTGLALVNMTEELSADLVETLGVDLTSKLVQQVVLTQSILDHDKHLDKVTVELTETLAKVTLEKEKLVERLTLQDIKLQEFERAMENDNPSWSNSLNMQFEEDRLLNMIRRHGEERRLLEERHQKEAHNVDMEIRHQRKKRAQNVGKQQSPGTGKQHYNTGQKDDDAHRYF
jgi:hypothetical protein